jgi:hypothetical protein
MTVSLTERESRQEKGQRARERYDSALVMIGTAGSRCPGQETRPSRLSTGRPGRG